MGRAQASARVPHPEPVVQPLNMDRGNVLDHAWIVTDDGDLTPPGDAAAWQATGLPHIWSRTHPGFEGTMWYRMQVSLPRKPSVMWAVYLPRVVMNAQVWVNGVPLAYTGVMTQPVTRNWYVPLLTNVPPHLWQEGVNVIHIRVASGFVSRNGLAPVQVGPLDHVAENYKHRAWAQVDGVHGANVALLTVGAFMLLVWVRDREQSAIGFMGLASVFWALGTLVQVAPNPLLTELVWENMAYIFSVHSQLLLCLFFFRFAGQRRVWVERFVFSLMVLIPLYGLLMPQFDLNTLFFALIYALGLWSMAESIWHVLRHGRRDGGWLVAGCLILVPAGAHDVMVLAGALPFDSLYWLHYAGPIMIACNTVIVAGDQARSRRALSELNRTLADRVAERERALKGSFERLAALERSQAVSAERSRILKDMHDGVGAHLTSALRQLQGSDHAPVDVPLVTQTLRDSLDQLKLSVDALSLMPGDVEGLLASWRFRLAPRLKAAGIELVWDVDRLPPWPAGQSPALRQLQYILFEGLSNVMQHSGATRLILSARDLEHHIRVSLIDNGKGWLRSSPYEGQGLQTMRTRAQAIGARMEFLPVPDGGLELRLSLPMHGEPGSVDIAVTP